jgi:RNA polymerase sigma-70 factor (ECF subfamily)
LEQNEEAEDALQEALTLLWERSSSYNASLGRPLSWAVALTRNKAIDRLRGRQRRSEWVSAMDVDIPEVPADQRPVDHSSQNLDQHRLLRSALDGLPTDQRRAIELAFFSGLSHAEVAGAMNAPLGTIKARIRRGMLTLRDGLEGRL